MADTAHFATITAYIYEEGFILTQTVQYEKQDHIIKRQAESEKQFLAEFAAGDYTLANPLVKLNPYFLAPLTAMVLFKTPAATEVTVTIHGKEPAGNIIHRFGAAKEHILPIYGLYAAYDNQVELRLANGAAQTITITTGPLNPDVPLANACQANAEYMQDNLIFTTASMRSKPAGYDYRGDLRWYSDENLCWDIKRLPNGHVFIGTQRLTGMPYYVSGIYEMAWSGKVFKEYRLPGGYHHDAIFMEDGNILALTENPHTNTVEDVCVLLDKNTGEILKKWDYKDVLPQYPVAGSGSQDEHDWFHNNAVWYDKKTRSLTLSGRHKDAVINLDYETGQLNWIIGDPEGWPEDMQKYFFTPVGEGDFDWQYEQHACMVLPDGDIMLFDNGHWRSKVKEKYLPNSQNFSRGVRYRIDTDKMTIEQIWQYGKERGAEFFSPYICNVEYYDEGHYMVHSGGIGYFDGKPCEGLAAMMMMGPDGDKVELRSITCELVNDEVVYELQIPANNYRAEKLPLYYAGEEAELGEGVVLGQMGVTKEVKAKLPAQSAGQLPEHYEAKVVEELDRIQFSAIFEEGEYAMLVLAGADGSEHKYAISTVAQDFQAMCVGTFQKANPQSVDVFVNKDGLSGKYAVKVLCEDKLYDTGVEIEA